MPLNNDDIKQLIGILQKALIEESELSDKIEGSHDTNTIAPTKKGKRDPATKRKRVNKKMANDQDKPYNRFESMPERNMHKDDTRIDKILSQYSPTQRTREFNVIDVVCRVCGKKESINASLVYDAGNRYKCNKCSRVPG